MNVKSYLLILTGLLFLLPAFAFSQSNVFYTVFVGNYPDPQAEQFSLLRRYGFLYKEDLQQNISKVYIGGFDNKKEAAELMNNIKPLYTEAQVVEQKFDPKNEVTVIQVATRLFNQDIEWEAFEPLENIYAMIDGDKIKVATGIYPSFEAARRDLDAIRNMGFDDAFIKNVNGVLLKRLSEFETGLKKPVIPFQLEERPVAVSQDNQQTTVKRPGTKKGAPREEEPAVVQQPNPRGYESFIPMQNQPQVQPKNPQEYDNYASQYEGVKGIPAQPDIRSQIKRRSVLELQKVLKQEDTYQGELDGYYGPGTSAGYERIKNQSKELQKYALLSQYAATGSGIDARPLQQAINELPSDPSAQNVIDGSSVPIAKAYRAYTLFNALGPSNEINTLMNSAIKEAYGLTQGPAPFDYSASYLYNNWNQLVLHILFLHAAPGNAYAAPCWLIEAHPQPVVQAQTAFANTGLNTFLMENCDNFMKWEEIQMLTAIAEDMNGGRQANPQEAAADASLRAQLYTTTASLENANQATYEKWNRDLWTGLNNWAMADPLHQKLINALKVTYFQSQVRLEDFYMDKGFKYEEAAGLALATLEALVGRDLQRFL